MLREREALLAKQGRVMISTLAISPDGEVVAYNDLVVPRGDRPNVYQWGTWCASTAAAASGMAVKARGLKEPQARIGPDRTRVSTCNAEQNQHMVSINERLGFRPVEVSPSFLRPSGGGTARRRRGAARPGCRHRGSRVGGIPCAHARCLLRRPVRRRLHRLGQ